MTAASARGGGEDALHALAEAGALGLSVEPLDGDHPHVAAPSASGVVRLGVHRHGRLPADAPDVFDILLSADVQAPAPWVSVNPEAFDGVVEALRARVARQPVAAAVAAQVLRMTLKLSFDEALALESLAYSMLLGSEAFKAWRTATPMRHRKSDDQPRLKLAREGAALSIRLTRRRAHNAVDARMRDALAEALDFALADPEAAPVILSGEGAAFSTGGDLDEFGQADDPGRAHAIRVLRYATGRVAAMSARVTARLHGPCIGAGIEIPAAAGRVIARPGALFRLPEVSMGLIPGAGGTASIPRRVGRQRACYMAISGVDLDVDTALSWGLVDAIDTDP